MGTRSGDIYTRASAVGVVPPREAVRAFRVRHGVAARGLPSARCGGVVDSARPVTVTRPLGRAHRQLGMVHMARQQGSTAPRIRRDMNTADGLAHSRGSQRPPGPTFARRGLTHEPTTDPESGAVTWRRLTGPGDAVLGPAVVNLMRDPTATPADVDRAVLAARESTVRLGDCDVALGAVLVDAERQRRRAARDSARRERSRIRAERAAAAERYVPAERVPLAVAQRRARKAAARRAAVTRAARKAAADA